MKTPFWKNQLFKLLDVISLKKGGDTTDYEGTIRSIHKSVQIRGANIWTLICGSLLASIGLDTNSATLLIGAMLISPLMIPAIGIGLFYAIHDWVNFLLSIKKLSIAFLVSLIASIIYFLITPFGDPTEEILARSKPTLIDAFIAFIGGIAGIISATRKDQTTALPGVAVAITLMPPICVMGFAISDLNWELAIGSSYYVIINTIVIAMASSIVVKLLDFPLKDKITRAKKKVRIRLAITSYLVILVPSSYFLLEAVSKDQNEKKINAFIEQYINDNSREAIRWEKHATDSTNDVKIYILGRLIPQDSLEYYENLFENLELKDYTLKIVQPQIERELKEGIAQAMDSIARNKNIKSSEDTIQLNFNSKLKSTKKEVKLFFPNIRKLQLTSSIKNNLTFKLKWDKWKYLVWNRDNKIDKIKKFLHASFPGYNIEVVEH